MTAAQESQIKFNQKLAYLQRLLTLRLRFMKYATGVEITYNEDTVFVKWDMRREDQPKGPEVIDYEMIEFPLTHLGRRIRHYKAKFRAEFNERHFAK